MGSAKNFQSIIFKEILKYLEPLDRIKSDNNRIVEFFHDMGYDILELSNNNPNVYNSNINTIVGLFSTISTSAGLHTSSILDTINAFKNLISLPNAFIGFKTSLSSTGGSVLDPDTNTPIINDIPSDLYSTLLIIYLKRHPIWLKH